MGNHNVGRAMASAAKVYWKTAGDKIPTKEEALSILDMMAENFHGADAEFDDELNEETPLSRLVAIAFDATPEEIADRDSGDGDMWFDGPEKRFSKRYKFC